MCFRPLAGLSCINPWCLTSRYARRVHRFRPLAGLSCINHLTPHKITIIDKFPSPRGVELHKPRKLGLRYTRVAQDVSVPSRG